MRRMRGLPLHQSSEHLSADFMPDLASLSSSKKKDVRFMLCYKNGKIVLPGERDGEVAEEETGEEEEVSSEEIAEEETGDEMGQEEVSSEEMAEEETGDEEEREVSSEESGSEAVGSEETGSEKEDDEEVEEEEDEEECCYGSDLESDVESEEDIEGGSKFASRQEVNQSRQSAAQELPYTFPGKCFVLTYQPYSTFCLLQCPRVWKSSSRL